MVICPTDFKHKITIQKSVTVIDNIGNHKNEWQDYFTCHADLSNENGREIANAGLTIADYDLAFTVRLCNKFKNLKSDNCRIKYNGDIFNIDSIDHMNFTNQFLKFKCKRERAYNEN